MKSRRFLFFVLPIVLSLSACGTPGLIERADDSSERARAAMRQWRATQDDQTARQGDVIEHVEGAWVARRSVAMNDRQALPPRFDAAASLTTGQPLPLSMLTAEIARKHGLEIRIARDVFQPAQAAPEDLSEVGDRYGLARDSDAVPGALMAQEPLVLVDYSGTLRGLLDALTDHSGTHWDYRDGRINIARLATRTFQIKAMPGTSIYSAAVGKKADTTADSQTGEGGDSGMALRFGAETRIAIDTKLNYWDDLVASVKSMLSPVGKVTPSTATNALAVTDTALVVDRVATYIEAENAVLARQVRLRVRVYSVQLTEESRAGVDWKLAFRAAGSRVNWGGAGAPAGNSVSVGRLGATIDSGQFKGSRLFLEALSKQGKAANVIDTAVVTLNNQPAPVAVTENEGYVAKVEISQGALGAGNLVTATQATLTTGFVMNLLPTLLDNRSVMLQVQVDMSQRKGMKTFSIDQGVTGDDGADERMGGREDDNAGGRGADNHAGGKRGGGATVQLPHTSSVQTMQRASLKSGETLVLSGFRRAIDSADRSGVYRYQGGVKSALLSEEEIIILISPELTQGV